MESQIWQQSTGSVGGGLSKGTMALLALMLDTSVSPYIPLVPLRLPLQYWSSVGVGLSRRVCVWVLSKEPFRTPAASSTDSVPTGFCSQKFWGHSSWNWNLGLGWGLLEGTGVGLGLFAPQISLLNFYPYRYEASLFHVRTPPTSLNGCGFFNSVAVLLPFNSISGVPE
ncbi:hypothetical protein HJG60_009905 [Phyllostomus discolor]|uniref:Uncharacterized protein n=1 Tax=Phyllostomus discolor TaxID=89673 RepID=A0A834EQG2_9CHIR|nr:hypothetical protein HJG60_009905 [Phyllostomus discolor]